MKSLIHTINVLSLFFLLSKMASAQSITRLWGMASEQGKYYKGSIFSANYKGSKVRSEYAFDLARPGENGCEDMFEYNGELYASAWQGNWGALIKWNPTTNVFTKLHDFDPTCFGPTGNLYFLNGKLYGLTSYGGVNESGTIYELDLATGVFTVKKSLGTLLSGSAVSSYGFTFMNGKFYGVVRNDSQDQDKSIFFEWDPVTNNITKTLLITDTSKPSTYRAMVPYNNKLYGVGTTTKNIQGALFEWEPAANVYTVKKQFVQGVNGYGALYELTLKDNKLYGSTYWGGANGSGVLYEFDPATDVYTKKIDLPAYANQSSGLNAPHMTLLNGKLYSTGVGGPNGQGYIFEWEPVSNAFNIRYNFDPQVGSQSRNRLTYLNGKFYASTYVGGKTDGGIMFSWDPVSGDFTKHFDFNIWNGHTALGSLTLRDEKLYGMTSKGGTEGLGVIFEFDLNTSTYKRLVDLDAAKGANPEGNLTLKDGKFYGMTKSGGANNLGTLFEWDPDNNVFTKKHDFGGAGGASPTGSLTLENGKLYGMTKYGGANNNGTIFEFDPDLNIHTKRIDLSEPDGGLPHGDLVFRDGKFYGMTNAGGASHEGVIFEWEPVTNSYTKKIDFDATKGTKPFGALTWWKDRFWGFTFKGGTDDYGTFFSWDPATNNFIKEHAMPYYLGSSRSTPIVYNGKMVALLTAGGGAYGGKIIEWNDQGKNFFSQGNLNAETGENPVYTSLTVAKVPALISNGSPGGCVTADEHPDNTQTANTWQASIDDEGNIFSEVNGHDNAIEHVFSWVHVHNGSALQDLKGNLFLGRNMTMSWTSPNAAPDAIATVRFYVKKEEVEGLMAVNNAKPGNTPIISVNDLTVFSNRVSTCSTRIGATALPILSTVEPYLGGYVFTFDAQSGSSFYIASKDLAALPVKLVDFSARLEEGNGLLTWKTTEEVQFSHFEIQRSTDGRNFVPIAKVNGSSKSIGSAYAFTDKGLGNLTGTHAYYRLKMVDTDESFAFSTIVQLRLSGAKAALFPNPASKNVRVSLSWESPTEWHLIDTNGQAVSAGKAASGQFNVDVQSLKPGFYILNVTSGTQRDSFKLVKE